MAPEEKQSELQRHRHLVLGTLDYLLEHFTGSIVYDGWDPAKEYYEQQKLQVEKYIRQRRLDRLQQQLRRLTEGLRHRADLQFAGYMKEKTGYDLDIFAELRSRVEGILAQRKILTEEESHDAGLMLNTYRQNATEPQKENLLRRLLTEFYYRTDEPAISSEKRKAAFSEIIKKVERNGIVEENISISTGPKPAHLQEVTAVSPDGKRKVSVIQWSNGRHASTNVSIFFEAANGAIYGTDGINPDVRVAWEDNSTIVIETRKNYNTGLQYKQVRSFEDVVTIKYIEH